MHEIGANAEMRVGTGGAGGAADAARLDAASAESKEKLREVLAQQTEALSKLRTAMRDAKRDLGVIAAHTNT